MARSERKAPPPPDPENGMWQGRSIARRFVSPDGLTVLVGRMHATARRAEATGDPAGVYARMDFVTRDRYRHAVEDIAKRPYITVGFLSWLMLVPLAVTSTTGWIKRLGRNWARLHMLVYPVAVLAVLHFWWLVKSDVREPLLYATILALLLGWRAWRAFSARRTTAAR